MDISSKKFRDALYRLNKCLEEDNLAALSKIQKMKNLSEDQIVVGIGIHLIQKLSGKAETNKKKSLMKCPCGCRGKLCNGEKMFIGNLKYLVILLSHMSGTIQKTNQFQRWWDSSELTCAILSVFILYSCLKEAVMHG